MTYLEFTTNLLIERRALGEESVVEAYGVHAAILDALGGAKSGALRHFSQSLRPQATEREDSSGRTQLQGHDIGVLQHRVRAAVASGEMA